MTTQNTMTQLTRIAMTLFIIVLIPTYWMTYGPGNFLWLSDIGLFLTVIALWLESPLLISVVAITILPVELLWSVDYVTRLITSYHLLGLSDYMFNSQYSVFTRTLSFFHIALPIIVIYYLTRWHYNRRALYYSIALVWIVFFATYFCTDADENINWVFLPHQYGWNWIPAFAWLCFFSTAFSLFIVWPMHIVLKKFFLHTKE